MRDPHDTDITSNRPGYVWHVYTHKPEGRLPYAAATEYRITSDNTREAQFPQERPVRVIPLQSPLTAKRKAAGIAEMVARLQELGYIASALVEA